ncbi:LysE family translocator [Pannonibacter sp. SL95]|uniref:LysE family translocator n=1 Tax=Pannonibacter sp. SL95 TaxID=2995153 RepID=UPI002273F37B|nr:LysE family translocator [Pannonibacter sp. SL95]MCY1707411.1 LysE family translocator [Pannonibacter sp. SL95]
MDPMSLLAFGMAFFVFAASPGPDNLTILSKTVSHGPMHGIAYGSGVVCSIVLFVVMAAVGFNALAQAMNQNLRFIQYAGALYLVYIGVRMWFTKPEVAPHRMRGGLVKLFLMGIVLNVSNPKMPVFYLALLPGVLGLQPLSVINVMELLLVIVLIEAVVIGGHVLIGHKAKTTLGDPGRIRTLNRGAGMLMVGAGVMVASR